MPIHHQGYRRYGGRRLPPGRAWSTIARTGVRSLLGRRPFIGLLLASWLPFLVRAVQIYAAANLPQAQFLAPTAETFQQFLGQQEVFLFFVTIYAGAGLVANDRRAHALQIYLSKPITRVEYIVGKLAVLFGFLLFVSWLPAMLLLVVQVLFSGSFRFLTANLALIPAITLSAGTQALTLALAMLALSSLSRSSRYVGVLYAGFLFFTQAMAFVLRAVVGVGGLAWLSVSNSLDQVSHAIFRTRLPYDTPVVACVATILVIVTAALIVLERQVRGVDVLT